MSINSKMEIMETIIRGHAMETITTSIGTLRVAHNYTPAGRYYLVYQTKSGREYSRYTDSSLYYDDINSDYISLARFREIAKYIRS